MLNHSKNSLFSKLLQKNKWFVWFLILVITIIWGYAWVYMKLVLEFMGPFTFSAIRFAVGSVTLLIMVWALKLGVPEKIYWKPLMIVGTLQTALVFLLVMYALMFVGAGKSSVLLYSMPIWSSLLAAKFLNEKITRTKGIGLTIGFIGLLSILGWDFITEQNVQVIISECLIILAAIAWAFSNVYYRLTLLHIPRIQMSAFQMTFGTIGLIIASLIMERNETIIINSTSVYYILFTGVLASALAFTVWFIILTVIDMVTATISTMLVPVCGLLLSRLMIGEQLTVNIIIGSIFIIFGIIVAQIPEQKRSTIHKK